MATILMSGSSNPLQKREPGTASIVNSHRMIGHDELGRGIFGVCNLPNAFSPNGAEQVLKLLKHDEIKLSIFSWRKLAQPAKSLRCP